MGHLPMVGEMDEVYPGRWLVQSHSLGVHEAMEMLISGACEEIVLKNAHFIIYTSTTPKAAGLGMVWLSLMSRHHVVQLEGITICKTQPCKSFHSQGRSLLCHHHTPLQPREGPEVHDSLAMSSKKIFYERAEYWYLYTE